MLARNRRSILDDLMCRNKNYPAFKGNVSRKKISFLLKSVFRYLFLLLTCLPLLAAVQKTTYDIRGVSGEVLKNVQKRLDELAKQQSQPLTQLPATNLKEQINKAIEPFGYFKSSINVRSQNNHLLILIRPGTQMHINQLTVSLTGEGAGNTELNKTIANLPIKEGDPLLTPAYNEAKELILSTAEHQGYLKGSFSTAEILIDKKNYTSSITLVFHTGPQYYFGQVIFNPSRVSPTVLQRYVPFQQGQPYSTDKIITLNNQLSGSGYFNSVVVKPQINSMRHVPIIVHTEPVPRYSYTLGAGYGTDTGVRGKASLHVIPVNRQGHKFNMIAQGSVKENALQAEYLIPGKNPVTDQYSLATSLGHIDYDSGNGVSALFSVSHRHILERYQRILSLNGLSERYSYTNQTRTDQFLLYPKANFTFRKISNPLFSPSGYNVSLNGLAAVRGLGSQVSLGQMSLDAKMAITFDGIRTRFYIHGIQGITAINDINQLPLSLSLLLGGNDNLKAYSFNSIGPGKILSFAGAEIQKETVNKWYLIGFLDAGDVYKPRAKAFKYDAGIGLMWVSPLGPIKVGVAQAINHRFERLADRSPKLVINMGPDL
ncbi:autotransporter assembly complex protein TamA [Legionella israelensis]|uniref:Outer membrane protein n=1 Tax=Legionella israelensis TaxID=454 RepID=A0A0W0V7B8_9GAMM|nr:BamA/TamA family outer membrane protein [Legionella israelensis]KTD16019.1 outer membrane protein [Legionella israelensis]SCY05571.1 autotransporter secretion outer membrane protein TamA [Legionella israelensis DSM 19235]STX58501.1 outer membrane protein [Legionella israelensis]